MPLLLSKLLRILEGGDDAVGNPRRAQISRFELFELKFLNSSFSSLSSHWNYTKSSLSSNSRQQHLSQRYPLPLLGSSTPRDIRSSRRALGPENMPTCWRWRCPRSTFCRPRGGGRKGGDEKGGNKHIKHNNQTSEHNMKVDSLLVHSPPLLVRPKAVLRQIDQRNRQEQRNTQSTRR